MADISFSCTHCSQHLEAPPDMAGMALECPSCNREIMVPKPALRARPPAAPGAVPTRPTAPAAPLPISPALASAAAPATRSAVGVTCPSCGAGAAADAVLCIQCGYHFAKKKKLVTREGGAAASSFAGGAKNFPAIAGLIALIVLAVVFILYRLLQS